MIGFQITTFYKFVSLPESELAARKALLEEKAREHGVFGLIIMGTEGINATVAARGERLAGFKDFLRSLPGMSDMLFKDSHSMQKPFRRFKVKIRDEVVTFEFPEPIADGKNNHLTPAEWNGVLEGDDPYVMIDTRNWYETKVGIFEGAEDPEIETFTDFKQYVADRKLEKDQKVLLYCTGGIRCEKALPYMQSLGYKDVYQLEGGILKYLEEFPTGKFKGECFVFDHRVSVDAGLAPSQTWSLCPHCGNPGKEPVVCQNCGTDAVICECCLENSTLHACSKNCAHHLGRRGEDSQAA